MNKKIALAYFPKVTFKRYTSLLGVFSCIEDVWTADSARLKKCGWNDELVAEFFSWKNTFDEEKAEQILKQEGIRCVLDDDAEYPELLKEIYDPPFCLFVRGSLEGMHHPLAIVGPRKFSPYGKQVTDELSGDLARHGMTIVSGLALGVDGIAHRAALRVKGKTVAVLGGGINNQHVQPQTHRELAQQIVDGGGAVISEYPPGALPNKYTFPRRNRIIAGMSLGTLVVEAAEKSGSLITAQCANDGGRDVFAVPQNITSPTSPGVHTLIKNGAHMVTRAEDVLEVYNLQELGDNGIKQDIIADNPAEAALLPLLSREPVHADVLTRESNLEAHVVSSTLAIMEMNGKVKNTGGMMYIFGG